MNARRASKRFHRGSKCLRLIFSNHRLASPASRSSTRSELSVASLRTSPIAATIATRLEMPEGHV